MDTKREHRAHAEGSPRGNPYDLSHSPSGSLIGKFRDNNSVTLSATVDMAYGYCDDYQPHAVKRMFDYKNGMLYGYYDADLMTMWLSVDPMSDKYPSISPYAYCAWNPVKLVDPDGKEFTVWIEDGEGNTYEYKPNMAPTGDAAAQQQIQTLNKMYSTSLGQEVLDVLIESGNDYYITNESTRTPGTSGTVEYGNGAKCKMGGNNTLLGISHELFHAFQYENCQGGATYKNEVEAYLYSNALVMEAGVPSIYQLGTLNPGTPDGDKFEKAMENLSGTSFSQTDFSTAVDLFQSQSRMNSAGTYNASYYTKGDPSNGSLLQQFYPLRR